MSHDRAGRGLSTEQMCYSTLLGWAQCALPQVPTAHDVRAHADTHTHAPSNGTAPRTLRLVSPLDKLRETTA